MEPVLTGPVIALCCELLSLFYPMEPVRHIDLLSNFLTCSESCRLWRDVAGCDLTFIEKNICNLRAVIWLLLVGRGSPGRGALW